MNFDLTYLEDLRVIVGENECFHKKTKKVLSTRKTNGYTYQYYNQFCTCIIRIRETSRYLESFKFRRSNDSGQAFDFYEFINCVSIIEGCIKALFEIFGKNYKTYYPAKKAFKTSNTSRNSDINFFKFIRSASSMHPAETSLHKKITKHKFEVYPYAIWVSNRAKNNDQNKIDIELLSWSCKTNCKYKYYEISTIEFFYFINNLLLSISKLIPIVNDILNEYKEKIRCKRLKKISEFSNLKDYCLYLRKRILSRINNEKCSDGGLLLASHLLSNDIIGSEFKEYIKKRVDIIGSKMITDITTISDNEIFEDLYLYEILVGNDSTYTSEKFHTYLYTKALNEIKNNQFEKIQYEESFLSNYNANYSVFLLLRKRDQIFPNDEFKKANTYTDLFEVTLEMIFHRKKLNSKLSPT